MDFEFYRRKKVLVTGQTGFKGTWLCKILADAGAFVVGYGLLPPTEPSIYNIINLEKSIKSIIGDIRDLDNLIRIFAEEKPEIVIHMAAQPIVRESYRNPVYTYEVNVMGTVNILECVRMTPSVKSVINVTTDKVYLNREWQWGYREIEELNGYDPYSNSKSCSELVTSSYCNSFFHHMGIAVSTVRAGNVIGGGDFACDRIIPDCIRSATKHEPVLVRNPYSVRPYQHVMEPIALYLELAKEQYKRQEVAGCYNIGPDEKNCITTGEIAEMFCEKWNKAVDDNIIWINQGQDEQILHEANYLKLDCSKVKSVLGWKPRWNVDVAMDKIVEWHQVYMKNGQILECMEQQIREFYVS